MVTRTEGWELRFSNYLKSARDMAFEWGNHDCIMFPAKALEVITGENFYEEYKGYTTKEGADEVLETNGGMVGIVTQHLGQSHRNFMQAKRGDLVLMKLPDLTLGIVDDSGQRIAAVTLKGLVRLPIDKAWRIWSY